LFKLIIMTMNSISLYYKTYAIVTIICLVFIITNLHSRYDSSINDKILRRNKIYSSSVYSNGFKKNKIKSITNSSVLCIIMTSEKTFIERSLVVWKTWARKCHRALFACNCANLTKILVTNGNILFNNNMHDLNTALQVPIWQLNLTEKYDNMGEKVFYIVKSAFNQYGHLYKWFLLTDDDTFTFVDNMHSFISKKSYEEPVTYGYNFKTVVPNGYHSGGGGILFTHESFKRISNTIQNQKCDFKEGYGMNLFISL
jgi:hypothetical protein